MASSLADISSIKKPQDILLDAISIVESSGDTDPARLKKNSQGALGEFQLKENLWSDIKRDFPLATEGVSFEEAALGPDRRRFARLALETVSNNLVGEGVAPTQDAILAAYNIGVGNLKRGVKMESAKRYLTKIRNAIGGQK